MFIYYTLFFIILIALYETTVSKNTRCDDEKRMSYMKRMFSRSNGFVVGTNVLFLYSFFYSFCARNPNEINQIHMYMNLERLKLDLIYTKCECVHLYLYTIFIWLSVKQDFIYFSFCIEIILCLIILVHSLCVILTYNWRWNKVVEEKREPDREKDKNEIINWCHFHFVKMNNTHTFVQMGKKLSQVKANKF